MKQILLFSVLLLLLAAPVSATYTNIFPASDTVIVNQSLVHDPTSGAAVPWALWILSGIFGILFSTFALTRSKTQKMDYEVNIILSLIAWPFFGYFAWGGMTTVDYIAGAGVTSTGTNTIAMITQHILYTQWALGLIGIMGFIAAVCITTLLASQYRLFNENEAEAKNRAQRGDFQ